MSSSMLSKNNEQDYREAWVIFTGKTDLLWLKILKKGFRHCFVLLNDGQRWISIDPLSSYTDIQLYYHIEPTFDLPQWLERQGHIVVQSKVNTSHTKAAPWMFMTCVEIIKRILGIHARFILTPWQLYKFLEQIKSNKNQNNRKESFHG